MTVEKYFFGLTRFLLAMHVKNCNFSSNSSISQINTLFSRVVNDIEFS